MDGNKSRLRIPSVHWVPKSQNPNAAHSTQRSQPGKNGQTAKRKGPPNSDSQNSKNKRTKIFDNRAIAAQKSHAAFKDGELSVQAFVNSMSFEIGALDESMRRTRATKTSRAFQRVPFTLRRRAAGHNYRRVPKRLQKRAKREMKEDNTPMVTARTRKPKKSKSRVRAEVARRLAVLARRKQMLRLKRKFGDDTGAITTRAARPKIRRNAFNPARITAPKFRKRQMKKIWLSTHLWHAKRTRMTAPSNPLWGFSIPLTPTQKVYRPTHRDQWQKGAIAWDMSYMSTIGLFGSYNSIQNVLKNLRMHQPVLWNEKGARWRAGTVSWSGLLSRRSQNDFQPIGPATVIWNPQSRTGSADEKEPARQVFIRIHPSAFTEAFEELLRLVKMQHPRPYLQDLRYEIGSIEVTGPDATEALLGVLKSYTADGGNEEAHAARWESLSGLRDPGSLPTGSLLAFSVRDPRLHHPPRRVQPPAASDQLAQVALLESISNISKEDSPQPYRLFDRDARFAASKLPSQQSLNRRRKNASPGTALQPVASDPSIPIILLASRNPKDAQVPGTWTLLLPWKCVLPVWYSLMHYPLSTGGNPSFGGLNEIRQLEFERGRPWFPGDFPGTKAGNTWELRQRAERKEAWERLPKGKRVNWETLSLGAGRKGEVGVGWSCDFQLLFGLRAPDDAQQQRVEEKSEGQPQTEGPAHDQKDRGDSLAEIVHIPKTTVSSKLSQKPGAAPTGSVVTVKVTCVARGVPTTCGRIYRLPTSNLNARSSEAEVPATDPPISKDGKLPSNLREQWLAQRPSKEETKRRILQQHVDEEARKQALAQQLVGPVSSYPSASPSADNINGHPLCPDEEDLVGFVTTGSFNLRHGRGEGIATLSAAKVIEELGRYKNPNDPAVRLCVIRAAGQSIGWLAKWELV
ncbi:ribonucleases P/MRP protein subunit POP1-domain-containing protein [Xylariomycetidae sp. FL0641]|nr:ribonucleases P/MRP protein subunit POP1-domain-containing protein [Xylariomycetidae sp. FL0641]